LIDEITDLHLEFIERFRCGRWVCFLLLWLWMNFNYSYLWNYTTT
jgi:hypothetical protein